MKRGLLIVVAALVAGRPPVAAQTRGHVTVDGVRLEYLDYGGQGTGLVFLPGLGDSPHAYDEIAPAFVDGYHVVSYARRAHGGSEARGPYDIPTLAEDLRQLLDSLRIRSAILVGWSMGGLEIAELAARHPGRVAGVVLLDSYDLSDSMYPRVLRTYPVRGDPSPADFASLAAFRRWWKRTSAPDVAWSPAMRAEVDDLVEQQGDGTVRLRLSDSLQNAYIAELRAYRPRYGAIAVPVLALQAEPYAGAIVAPDASRAVRRQVDGWIRLRLRPWQDSVHARFARALPAARVVVLPHTGHAALPFQRRDVIVRELRRFLRTLTNQ